MTSHEHGRQKENSEAPSDAVQWFLLFGCTEHRVDIFAEYNEGAPRLRVQRGVDLGHGIDEKNELSAARKELILSENVGPPFAELGYVD